MLPPLYELAILKKMGLQVVLYHLKKIFTPNFNIILPKDCCVIDSILYSFQNVSAFVTISSYLLQNLNSSTLEVFFVVTELHLSLVNSNIVQLSGVMPAAAILTSYKKSKTLLDELFWD